MTDESIVLLLTKRRLMTVRRGFSRVQQKIQKLQSKESQTVGYHRLCTQRPCELFTRGPRSIAHVWGTQTVPKKGYVFVFPKESDR